MHRCGKSRVWISANSTSFFSKQMRDGDHSKWKLLTYSSSVWKWLRMWEWNYNEFIILNMTKRYWIQEWIQLSSKCCNREWHVERKINEHCCNKHLFILISEGVLHMPFAGQNHIFMHFNAGTHCTGALNQTYENSRGGGGVRKTYML